MEKTELRFYFELAEKLSMTVQQLLRSITSKELSQWMILWKVRAAEREHERNKAKSRPRTFG